MTTFSCIILDHEGEEHEVHITTRHPDPGPPVIIFADLVSYEEDK